MRVKLAEVGRKIAGSARKKIFAFIPVLIMVLFVTISGTVAWLVSEPEPVVNTFTYGYIEIGLEESDTGVDGDGDVYTNKYKMIPGEPISKDAVVTVKQGSESCWLFITLAKSSNFDEFLSFELARDGEGNDIWTALDGVEGVYFTQVDAADAELGDYPVHVFLNDEIVVKSGVTRQMLESLGAEDGDAPYPTITVDAVSVQYEGFEPGITHGSSEPDATQIMQAAARAWNEIIGA